MFLDIKVKNYWINIQSLVTAMDVGCVGCCGCCFFTECFIRSHVLIKTDQRVNLIGLKRQGHYNFSLVRSFMNLGKHLVFA